MTSESVGRHRLSNSPLPTPMLLHGRLVIFLVLVYKHADTSLQVAILPGQSGSVLVHKSLGEEEVGKEVDRMASVLNTDILRLQELVAYNEGEIYFTAGDPTQPGSAHLYSLNLPPLQQDPNLQTSDFLHNPNVQSSNSTSPFSSPSPVCISCHQNDPSCLSSRFTAAPKVIQPVFANAPPPPHPPFQPCN